MLGKLMERITGKRAVPITAVKRGTGWLAGNLPDSFDPTVIDASKVRRRATQTGKLGAQPLWEGYRNVADYPFDTSGDRTSNQVRTDEDLGCFYAWLAASRAPDVIVEFGTAFGVSGMFWLTGLEQAGHGRLMTYEPNAVWADIAGSNLSAISDQFTLTRGTFEDHAVHTLEPNSVDIAFIDAIHTSDFVHAQFAILRPFLKPNALVVFDDVNFSPDMQRCWSEISNGDDVRSSYNLGQRAGIVEMAD